MVLLIVVTVCSSVCVVTAAVSAPLLDVLASAAVEQPPLEMPAAASAAEPLSDADTVAEPMPTVSADAQDVREAWPFTSTPLSSDMSLVSGDELVAVITRFLLYLCCLQLTLIIRT